MRCNLLKLGLVLMLIGASLSGYQLPTSGPISGGTAQYTNETLLVYSAAPAEGAGLASAPGSYSANFGLIPTYGDTVPPTMSMVAVLSGLTIYNVDDVLQISFSISKPLIDNPVVTVNGHLATFVTINSNTNTYTYELSTIYGDNGYPLVEVYGVDFDGYNLQVSEHVTIVVMDTTLKAPTGFTGYYDTPNHTYRLSWDNMPNENGYIVEAKLAGYPWVIFDTLAKDTTSFVDNTFVEGIQTEYRVKSIYDMGAGNVDDSLYANWGPAFVALTQPLLTGATFNLVSKNITVTWTAGSPSAYEYKFRRSENDHGWVDLVTLPSGQTTYIDTSIEYGKTYQYELVAVNQYGGQALPQLSLPVHAGQIPIPDGMIYWYDNLSGPSSEPAHGKSEVNLQRSIAGGVIGYMNVDAVELDINLMFAGMETLMITRNVTNGMIEINVPTATAIAQAVNNDATHQKKVPVVITGLPTDKIPFIYVNGSAITDIDLQLKSEYADYVRNIVWNKVTGELSFEITHFSKYSVGLINTVAFNKTQFNQAAGSNAHVGITVRDNYNELVEGAPVVLKIESGLATFIGGGTQRTITTNANGTAYMTVILPAITGNISILSATIENVTSNPNCQLTVGEEIVSVAYPTEPELDYDHDGLVNIQEYNRGTNPYDPDTDDDGVDDWHDGYPLDTTRWQYNMALDKTNPLAIVAESYTGTGPNVYINSYSADLVLTYPGGTRNGLQCGVPSITDIRVLKISGLAYPRIEDGGLGEVYAGGNLYTNFIPGELYPLRYFFVNRGNGVDTYHIQTNLEQVADHWSYDLRSNVWPFNPASSAVVLAPWQLGVFNIVVSPTSSLHVLERAVLNVPSVELVMETAVSYNAFAGAYIGNTYRREGMYGGVQSIASQNYIFESEGNNMIFVTRSAEIVNPSGVTSNLSGIVPGASITYSVVLRNGGRGIARDVVITDRIPQNCHLYYTKEPTANGAVLATWEGATSNAATAVDTNAIRYKLTIMPSAVVTFSYTVTVD